MTGDIARLVLVPDGRRYLRSVNLMAFAANPVRDQVLGVRVGFQNFIERLHRDRPRWPVE